MNEDNLNMQVRKFLKKVGITAQREIEQRVRDGVADGTLSAGTVLSARMHLVVEGAGIDIEISDTISID